VDLKEISLIKSEAKNRLLGLKEEEPD